MHVRALTQTYTYTHTLYHALAQVHSWAHGMQLFTFRYFDDGKRALLQYSLGMRDITPLLEHIQSIVELILAERKVGYLGRKSEYQMCAYCIHTCTHVTSCHELTFILPPIHTRTCTCF